MTPRGFPHSDIPGSTLARRLPGLFAACHVLLRLLAPRHPPCALSSSAPTPSQARTRRSCALRTALCTCSEVPDVCPASSYVRAVHRSPSGSQYRTSASGCRLSIRERSVEPSAQAGCAVDTKIGRRPRRLLPASGSLRNPRRLVSSLSSGLRSATSHPWADSLVYRSPRAVPTQSTWWSRGDSNS